MAAITSQPFEDEDANVEVLLKELNGPLQRHVEALGLSALVNQLSQVHTAFHAALQVTKKGELSFDKVTAQENLVQERLSGLVMLIAANYRKGDAESLSQRARLLDPILDQNERISDIHKR